ncbi:TPA: hypothetical protein ACOKAZ_000629 [Enterobacter hormaechei]
MLKTECPRALKHRADDNKNETSGVHNIFLFCYYGELIFCFAATHTRQFPAVKLKEVKIRKIYFKNIDSAKFILFLPGMNVIVKLRLCPDNIPY